MIAVIAVLPERQDHRRAGEGLQPASVRGHRLTDRRRLTRLRKRLPAQARPVITRANNSKLARTTTALDQPNQIYAASRGSKVLLPARCHVPISHATNRHVALGGASA